MATTTSNTANKVEKGKELVGKPVKEELQELTGAVGDTMNKNFENATLIKSVDELNSLSTVLNTFRCRWEDLQKHLDFIQTSIKDLEDSMSIANSHHLQQNQQSAAEIVSPSQTQIPTLTSNNENPKPSRPSELEHICQTMCGRGLRRYIINHLSKDLSKLRVEVISALKMSPNPAKLVLHCVGRFFLQGVKAFGKDSPMIPARTAAILILEFLLFIDFDHNKVEPAIMKEAESAALDWRKRLVTEGGISKTNRFDARGLLLFIASFGIPSPFRNDEIKDLILLSNPVEISDALRHSRLLLRKLPDIIKEMLKNKLEAEAVDIVFIFGLDDMFSPQQILTSFLQASEKAFKKAKKDSRGSSIVLRDANKKYLADLQHVSKCLENHKIDASKFLPGSQISKRTIGNLEKDIDDLEKKIKEERLITKRKHDDLESLKLARAEAEKRARYTTTVSPMLPINYNNAVSTSTSFSNSMIASSSFPGAHRDLMIDKIAQKYSGSNSYQPYGRPSVVDSDPSYARHQRESIELSNMYRQSTSVKGFAGLLTTNSSSVAAAANRSSGTDLYHFADTVLEGELGYDRGSRTYSIAANPGVPAYHPAYPF